MIYSQIYDEVICSDNFTIANPDKKVNTDLYKFIVIYASDNLSRIKIFFRDPYFTMLIKDEKIPLLTALGSAGGLLGLCIGFSFISFFEIFYFCFLKSCEKSSSRE